MTDRRRFNGPASGTTPPVFFSSLTYAKSSQPGNINCARPPIEPRKIFLKTGLTPSASGSAYLELEQAPNSNRNPGSFVSRVPSLKLTCTVHGPRALPRSAAFTPNALLSTTVKFAPFATRARRGYLRDSGERDLAVHLETALRGVIIAETWPKSGIEVIVTVLEGEEEPWWNSESSATQGSRGGSSTLGMMSVLSGCITVASAAIADADLDCVDLVSGGVAAIVRQPRSASMASSQVGSVISELQIVLDPIASEYLEILAICVVGYLRSRDEISELWMSADTAALSQQFSDGRVGTALLVDAAVQAAVVARHVLVDATREFTELRSEMVKAGNGS